MGHRSLLQSLKKACKPLCPSLNPWMLKGQESKVCTAKIHVLHRDGHVILMVFFHHVVSVHITDFCANSVPKRWLLLVVICQAVEALLFAGRYCLWQHSRMHHTAALKLLLRTSWYCWGRSICASAEASAMN